VIEVPHILVLDVTVTGAGFAVASSATQTVIVEGDGELVIVAASCSGFLPGDIDEVPTAGLHGTPNATPDGWPATVQVSEEAGGFRLSDKPVRVSAMFGSAERPCRWPVPWVLRPGAEVRIDVTQFWNVSQRAFFSFYGYKRDPAGSSTTAPAWSWSDTDQRVRHLLRSYGAPSVSPFWFGFSFDELTGRSPLQSETRHVTISGCDFAALNLYAGFDDPSDGAGYFVFDDLITEQEQLRLTGAGPPTGGPPLRVTANTMRLALDNGAVRLDDRPVAVVAECGTGRRPGMFARPLLVEDGRSLSATVLFADASLGTNTATRGYITVGGVRIGT